MRVRNIIFWNFLIRYFQASLIGFNVVALVVVLTTSNGLKGIISSALILLVQYGIVIFVAYFLTKKDLGELNKPSNRQRFGNLYFNLDTHARKQVLFGFAFFV